MSKGSSSHNYDYIPVSSSQPKYQGHRLSLILRQQPAQARVSTSNERDRKPIEPPPIIQIQLQNGSTEETQDFLQNPYLFMNVNLINATTREDIVRPDNRVLSGQTVSSMYKLKDITDNDGGFFCFGDLSSRLEGEYRLKFTLFEIVANGAVNLMHTFSKAFKVYNSKNMPKLLDATFLSRSFSDQGLRIRIRKEHRVQMTTARKRKLSTDDESVDSLTQHHEYDTPASSIPTKRLSLTAPISPTYNSYYTLHDQQKLHHLSSRSGHQQLEVYASPPSPLERDHNSYDRVCHSHQQPFNDYMYSIPFSPPPQPYDIHSRPGSMSHSSQYTQLYYHHHHHHHHHNSNSSSSSNNNNNSHSHNHYQQRQEQEQEKYRHDPVHPYYQHYPSPTAMLSPPSAQLKLEHRWQSADDDKLAFPLSPRASILSTTSSVTMPPYIPASPTEYQHRESESSVDSASTTEWGYNHIPQKSNKTGRSPLPSTPAIRLPPLRTMISRHISDSDNYEAAICPTEDNKKNDVGEVNAAVAMMQLSRRQSMITSPNQHSVANLERVPQPAQYSHHQLHPYRYHQLDLPQCELLDPSRRASTGIMNTNSY